MMASFQIVPPEQFTFDQPEEWPKWIRRFERFREASGLSGKEDPQQINTLIYCMGDAADDILTSLNLMDDERKAYDTVKTKLEAHFIKKRNVIFERSKFNRRIQQPGESVDSFITALHCLAEHCQYGNLRGEMIRDRIVVGLLDENLSMKLQLDPELTLEKATAAARQHESVRQQQEVIRGGQTPVSVEAAVQSKRPGELQISQPKSNSKQFTPPQNPYKQPQKLSCTRCGKAPFHPRHQCPAREAECHKCRKIGHFQSMCRTIQDLSQVQTEQTDFFLSTINNVSSTKKSWTADVMVNGIPIQFKIDTGAEVTAIPLTYLRKLANVKLCQATKVLHGPSKHPLKVSGQFTGMLSYKQCKALGEIFVVEGLLQPLLGLPAIESLHILSGVNTISYSQKFENLYPDLFNGLGNLAVEYHIQLKDNAKSFSLSTPRRVALPLLPKVKAELTRMEDMGVISKVDTPTEWCAGMVVVPKSDGNIRICVDLTKLNESVCRAKHILPSVEQILAQLGESRVFTKLDANAGFWQIHLSNESALLTTFITPYGRFCFNRLPFGINSAPEFFQKQMSKILDGLPGVLCMIDDILVHGRTQQEHDKRLITVLDRLRTANVTLNKAKCEFSKSSIKFLGQVIDQSGIQPDPDKVTAIQTMTAPTNITELRRFLGMTNQLSKFTPHLSDTIKPLRDLLSTKNSWVWGPPHQEAFQTIKQQLSSAPVLAFYHPGRPTVVSADSSSYGLGAVLTQQQHDGTWRPVAYCSRSLSTAEQRYAQIEKEALASTWACDRFNDYLLGKQFHIETDHKPLVTLLGSKNIDELPIRLQRFRLRLMRYSYTISHVPGKQLTVADALSRAPICSSSDDNFSSEVEAYINLVVQSVPATATKLQAIRDAQAADEVCQKLFDYCRHGWPHVHNLPGLLRPYRSVASDLTVHEGLLLRGSRIVIPTMLRLDILDQLHSGHQGITKCRARARQCVWWPGINTQIQDLIRNCPQCCHLRRQPPEPLIPSEFPTLPWKKVATDLFHYNCGTYLLIVDYFSRFIEITKLRTQSSSEVIQHTKEIFSRHGVPQEVTSDNGPQYSSFEYSQFAAKYGFTHTTSSPQFPQSNGEAERAVQTIKQFLKKSKDPHMALMIYHSTPLQNGYSPSELLMNRKIRTPLPIIESQLLPSVPDYSIVRERETKQQNDNKANFNTRHRARNLEPLDPGQPVWITGRRDSGVVIQPAETPRSYLVSTPTGTVRRNRQQLTLIPVPGESFMSHSAVSEPDVTEPDVTIQTSSSNTQMTRSGRLSVPPNRLISDPNWNN